VPSDWLRVSWLIESSRRVFTHWGGESLRELLSGAGAVVWQQGRALRGVLLTDVRRREVGEVRLLAVHDDAYLPQFGEDVFALAERRLAHHGTRWLSFSSPDDWLRELLVARGYCLKDRVIAYARQGIDLSARGNPDVAVRPALPEHLPDMLAVDADAFEPFWRLDRDAMRRTLDEDACVLVALGGVPLPSPPPGYGEREQARQDGDAGAWRTEGSPPHSQLSAGSAGVLSEYSERGQKPSLTRGETWLSSRPDYAARGPDAVIGYLVADVWEARAHIVRLAVAPEYQGRGVATRLLDEAFRLLVPSGTSRRASDLRDLGGEGVREVTLNTQETNARSRALYERLGFRATGRVEEVWARALKPPGAN